MKKTIEYNADFEQKCLTDDELIAVAGGTGPFTEYKMGDEVFIVMNCTPISPEASGGVKVIALRGIIASEPYPDCHGELGYDVLIDCQSAIHEGYRNYIGTTIKCVTARVLDGAVQTIIDCGLDMHMSGGNAGRDQ